MFYLYSYLKVFVSSELNTFEKVTNITLCSNYSIDFIILFFFTFSSIAI